MSALWQTIPGGKCGSVLLMAGAIMIGTGRPSIAGMVPAAQVRQAAERWLALNGAAYSAPRPPPTVKTDPSPVYDDDKTILLWHVPLAPRGYLIMQPDDRLDPVRAFSAESDLVLDDLPANTLRALLWRDQRRARAFVAALDASQLRMTTATSAGLTVNSSLWNNLLSPAIEPAALPTPTNILVYPLLTTTWSQWNHYNDNCPPASPALDGYDGRCPVGCVAVVGAQIMKYYSWPPFGAGAHTYTDSTSSVTGTFSAVFTNTCDWSAMLTNYSAYSSYPAAAVEAIARIMFDTGVAVDMNYSTDGSSASLSDLMAAFSLYFRQTVGSYLQTNSSSFVPRLRSDLLARRPVGVSIPGHSVVADGLSSDSGTNVLHINYGWGGFNDGWYLISDINGNSLEDAVVGIEPFPEPLLAEGSTVSNLTGVTTVSWNFPNWHTGHLERFVVDRGVFTPTNFSNTCSSLGDWYSRGDAWVVSNSIGVSGTPAFYKADNLAEGALILPPLIPGTNSGVRFTFRAMTFDSPFSLQVSTNLGLSWTSLFSITGIVSWTTTNVSLSAFSSQECRLRFNYQSGPASTYYTTGYIYLDNVVATNISWPAWSSINTNVSPGSRSLTCTNTLDGLAYFRVQAYTSGVSLTSTTFLPVYSDLAGDTDGDTIPNGWEFQWSGNPTNMAPTADNDGDGMSNLKEYLSGTCPTSAASLLALTAIVVTNKSGLTWQTVSGHCYSAWRSTNLMDPNGFTRIATGLLANADALSLTDTNAPPDRPVFYRISAD